MIKSYIKHFSNGYDPIKLIKVMLKNTKIPRDFGSKTKAPQ